MIYRDLNCNELTKADLGKKVRLAGWIDTVRDHGGVLFVDLRDEYGITQVVFHNDELLKGVKKETVISVFGEVVERDPETVNGKLSTGEVELMVEEMTVLGACSENLPFYIEK